MSAYLEKIAEQGVRVLSLVSFWKDAAYMHTVLVCLPLSIFQGEHSPSVQTMCLHCIYLSHSVIHL